VELETRNSTERTEAKWTHRTRQQEIVAKPESNPKSCVRFVKHGENSGKNKVSIEPDEGIGKRFSSPVGLGFYAFVDDRKMTGKPHLLPISSCGHVAAGRGITTGKACGNA
jgi:hypothetical protein